MKTFSIDTFAADCKRAMDESTDRSAAARASLAAAVERFGPAEIIRALEAAVPAGASIGELIVHASPELTLLYGRMPPRFQSGIHDHTVGAVIAQLEGQEINRIFERGADGSLREVRSTLVRAGELLSLDKDVVHCIENPTDAMGSALHLYEGDFRALSEHRSLWSWDDRTRKAFSFPELLKESATAMHRSGNRVGLESLVAAMPASKAFVDVLDAAGTSGK